MQVPMEKIFQQVTMKMILRPQRSNIGCSSSTQDVLHRGKSSARRKLSDIGLVSPAANGTSLLSREDLEEKLEKLKKYWLPAETF
jgi:hypothetical protein